MHMNTLELLKELLDKPKQELEYAITTLMIKEKINFLTINESYVKYLELTKKNQKDRLYEASSCLVEQLIYNGKPKAREAAKNAQDRSIYFLDSTNQFQLDAIKKRLNYDSNNGEQKSKLQ